MSMRTLRGWYRRPERWWRDQRVVTCVALSTRGGVTAPVGTRARVTQKFKGLTLQTDPCPHCGVTFRISRVPVTDLRWDVGYPKEST